MSEPEQIPSPDADTTTSEESSANVTFESFWHTLGQLTIAQLTNIVAGLASVLGVAIAIILWVADFTPMTPPLNTRLASIETQITDHENKLDQRIQTLETKLAAARTEIQTLTTIPDDAKMSAAISKLETSTAEIANRQSKLEATLMDNPAKAIELPLLRKDVDNLAEVYKSDLEDVKNEIARVYDQNKWFIGLMFTMAVGVLGLALTNFLTAKGEKTKSS